jgi:hypothetical protein
MPGTFTDADVFNIETKGQKTEVYATSGGPPADPAAPSGTQIVTRRITELNRANSERLTSFDVLNAIQRRGFAREHTQFDVNLLKEEAIRWKVYNEGDTPPAAPDDPPTNNVKLIFKDDIPLRPNVGGVVKEYLRWFLYGPKDTADELILANEETVADSSDLHSTAIRSMLDGGSISDPSGYVLRFTKTLNLTRGLATNRVLTVKIYGKRTTAQDITFPGTWANVDGSTIGQVDSTGRQTDVYDSASPPAINTPSGQIKRFTKTFSFTSNQVQREVEFGVRTPQQDIEFLKSKYVVETGQLDRETIVAKVQVSSVPDSTGLNPDTTNLSLYWSESHQETNSGLWTHLFAFRPLTATEALTAKHERDDVDPASLEDEHTRVIIDANLTAPADPGVAGQVLYKSWTVRTGKAKYLHVYLYRYRTSAQALVAESTRTTIDKSAMDSTAVTATVWLVSGGAPADPVSLAALTNGVLVEHEDREVLNPLYRLRIYRWGLVTTKQKREFAESKSKVSLLQNYIDVDGAIVAVSGTRLAMSQALLAANQNDRTFVDAEVTIINPQLALQIIVRTGEDKRIHDEVSVGHEDKVTAHPPASVWHTQSAWGNPSSIVFARPYEAQSQPGPGGATLAIVEPIHIFRTQGRFKVRRRIPNVSYDNLETYRYHSLKNKVTGISFWGHEPHTAMYTGAEADWCEAFIGLRTLTIDYCFNTDSEMFFRTSNIPDGRVPLLPGAFIGQIGFYDPRNLFGANMTLIWPEEGDFSVFFDN